VVWSMRAAVVNVYNPTTIFYNKAIATLLRRSPLGPQPNENPSALHERNRPPVEE
jgi:hypothetical protein